MGTASTESQRCPTDSMLLCALSPQWHVHRQLGVLKMYKSLVCHQEVVERTVYINVAEQITFFESKHWMAKNASEYSFFHSSFLLPAVPPSAFQPALLRLTFVAPFSFLKSNILPVVLYVTLQKSRNPFSQNFFSFLSLYWYHLWPKLIFKCHSSSNFPSSHFNILLNFDSVFHTQSWNYKF